MIPGRLRSLVGLGLALAPLLLAGCEVEGVFQEPDPSLNRMIDQPRMDAYAHNEFFEDGRVMRSPPLGTVHRGMVLGPAELVSGRAAGGAPVDRVPVDLDRDVLERGRNRYDIFCAPCHGPDGFADTPVARNMHLVRPPSLHNERVRNLPAGRIFEAIDRGYGVMPSYRAQLDLEDRWAVVAYVQALQLSQNARLDELPPALRREAEEVLE